MCKLGIWDEKDEKRHVSHIYDVAHPFIEAPYRLMLMTEKVYSHQALNNATQGLLVIRESCRTRSDQTALVAVLRPTLTFSSESCHPV